MEKRISLVVCTFLLSSLVSNHALAKSFSSSKAKGISITPIIGFERVQKFEPTPTMKTRMIYGARVLYPLPVTSLELEYTHGQDTSYSPETATSYKDQEDKVKLGLRGSTSGRFVSAHLRGGAQARKNKQTKTVNGVTTTKSGDVKVNPYLGTGLGLNFFNIFSLDSDVTVIYTPTKNPALKDYEIQPSVGITVHF